MKNFFLIKGLILVFLIIIASNDFVKGSELDVLQWNYKKNIIIDNNNIDSDLTDFPLYIYFNDSDIASHASLNGHDIRFTDNIGNELSYERESFVIHPDGKAEGHFWLKTNLLSDSETEIWIYYGNNTSAAGADGEDTMNVWDDAFAMVQHLEESPANGVAGHIDSTINSNNGTPYNFGGTKGSTTNAVGKINGADEFDGNDDYVDCGIDDSLSVKNKNQLTVSLWAKRTSSQVNQVLYGDAINGDYWKFILIWGYWGGSGDLDFMTRDTSSGDRGQKEYISTTAFTQDTWHHIVAIYDNTNDKKEIWVDGVLKASTSDSVDAFTNIASNWIRIGSGENNFHFNGIIDEVRVSNIVRPDAWIKFEFFNNNENDHELNWSGEEDIVRGDDIPLTIFFVSPPTPENGSSQFNTDILINVSAANSASNISTFIDFDNSLVGWWRMDDVSGTGLGATVYDNSIYGNDGTAVGDAAQTDAGKLGKAFEFDGVNDRINIPYYPDVNSRTLTYWIKFNEVRQHLSGTNDGNNRRFYAGVDSNWDAYFGVGDTFKATVGAGLGVGDIGKWHMITMTANGSDAKYYVDAVEKDSFTYTFSGTSTHGFRIGEVSNGLGDVKGTIDDVMIFNRTLSVEEIRGLYANKSSEYLTHNFTNIAEGSHTFKAYTQDLGGNLNETEKRSVNILEQDIDPPLVSFDESSPEDGAIVSTPDVNIKVNTNENVSECILYLSDLSEEKSLFNITVKQSLVDDWDLKYPVTYIFDIPSGSSDLKVYKRVSKYDEWKQLTEYTSNDFFNGVEGVRFDYPGNKAYVSIGFNQTNIIYLKFNNFNILYNSTAKYYDNSVMAFSLSNDNWGQDGASANGGVDCNEDFEDSSCDKYQAASLLARYFNIPITFALNTGNVSTPHTAGQSGAKMNNATWSLIQKEINSGGVEVAIHTRTHPCSSFQYQENGYEFEIIGSKNDILTNLNNFSYTDNVLTFIEPCGYEDESLYQTSAGSFLFLRDWKNGDSLDDNFPLWLVSYGFYQGGMAYTDWDSYFQSTSPRGIYNEGNVNIMKGHFDNVYSNQGVMFAMWHADRYSNNYINNLSNSSLVSILGYVSNRKDVWYAANGWLMSYHKVYKEAGVYKEDFNEYYFMEILEGDVSAEYNLNLDEGFYNYYVKCEDLSENIGVSETRSITVKESILEKDYNLTYIISGIFVTPYGYLKGVLEDILFNNNSNSLELDSTDSGNYTSQIFDADFDVVWDNISWSRNEVGKLDFSVRSCNDPNCNGEIWRNIGNSSKELLIEDNQYFQYRAEFERDELGQSPKLYNVTITNSPMNKINVTLNFDLDIYNQYVRYCDDNNLVLIKQLEWFMKSEMG